jgi:dienelactone hydrolase
LVKTEEWTKKEIAEACSFSGLIDRVYDKIQVQDGGGEFSFSKCVHTKEDFLKWAENYRKRVIELCKIKDMLDTRGDVVIIKGDSSYNTESLTPKQIKKYGENSYTVEHFYIKSWADTLIPVLLCKPKNLKSGIKVPGFVCAHGHGQNKMQLIGREENKRYPNSTWAKDIAEMGCITIAMDQWGWAERGGQHEHLLGKRQNYDKNEGKYALNMLQFGRTINGLRYFDAIRQVDYLLSRDDIDPKRIGVGGLSLGGTTSGWVFAMDPRINLGLIAGYMNTFKDSIIDISHCSCNYIPGISKLGEMYDLFSLHAPRPVCYITGVKDGIYPVEPFKKSFQEIQKAYKLMDAEDKCLSDITPFGHRWRGDIAYPFLKKQWNL